jgi:hypothetical protein
MRLPRVGVSRGIGRGGRFYVAPHNCAAERQGGARNMGASLPGARRQAA